MRHWCCSALRHSHVLHDLSGMRDGNVLAPWSAPDLAPLILSVGVLVGVWLLLAGFGREAQRLKWAWARPRNLTTRNASETPQTMGVVLNYALGLFGMWAGLIVLFRSSDVAMPWWSVFAWMAAAWTLRTVAGLVIVGAGDTASAWVEISRHNQTWMGMALAAWCVVACMNPYVMHGPLAGWGVVTTFVLTMGISAIRATQLLNSARPQRVVGILYLCLLEWSWTLFWILWSVRVVFRGH